MICSRCGQTVSDGAAFCPACGQQTIAVAGGLPPLPPPGVHAVPAEKTGGMAIASLVFGILFLFFPLNILAIIFGHISLSQIKASAGRLGGRGLAVAGLVLGYLGIAHDPAYTDHRGHCHPNLLRARIAANETSAAQSIRIINTAQVTYQDTYQTVGYAPGLAVSERRFVVSGPHQSGQSLLDRRPARTRDYPARPERVHLRHGPLSRCLSIRSKRGPSPA